MFQRFLSLAVALLLGFSVYAQSDLKAVYLRCEYKINPVTDVTQPRLSWELTSAVTSQYQTGYQILVATSVALLEEGKADLWDSKKVTGETTSQIEYAGKPLESRQICYWKVRSWDKKNGAGPWSEPARWEMGLLQKKRLESQFYRA